MSQLQKFSQNIEKLEQSAASGDPASPESQSVDRSPTGTSPADATVSPTLQQLRKAQKRRDKALKEILTLDNRYCLKFLLHWSKTANFRHWVRGHDTELLAALSPQYPSEEEVPVLIYYETGDVYRGNLKQGKRHGAGYYYDRAGKMTYNGQFANDKRHGLGTLCSEQDSSVNQYIYDGEWFEGVRNGLGQEVNRSGKYNGEWLEDHRHGEGISVDPDGNMYQGLFMFGKKHGRGKLTKPISVE